MLPTFSPYYEYVNKKTTSIHFYPLYREKDKFVCDLDDLLRKINDINNIVLINPIPDSFLINKNSMADFLEKLSFMDNILLDESFNELTGTPELIEEKFYNFKNITIIRLMSKVFGIAGIKAGYCITKASYVK